MCKHGDTVELLVTVPAHLASDGKAYRGLKPVDRCIAPIVQALNEARILTLASCCGHGKGPGSIVLQDGRELTIRARLDGAAPEVGS